MDPVASFLFFTQQNFLFNIFFSILIIQAGTIDGDALLKAQILMLEEQKREVRELWKRCSHPPPKTLDP